MINHNTMPPLKIYAIFFAGNINVNDEFFYPHFNERGKWYNEKDAKEKKDDFGKISCFDAKRFFGDE
ncbi:MAG: hypothetical protein A2604_01615 [Candidatus Liptonbacteria bacterium RIFOXYD1_FULL_36_11]|uniref:Uncharacterized protein n=1 Tax=Candidatus Liptonbacteria bacterium RIFOXYD1_FULL_36_11 TaxID=1798656 RepID=A0A1G2CSK1_9BACT|nr:MAG: hypothetical protein A2604_01615 [Candidatus Liptonbacteria bacterium RIFOXYD1_FULL_36_11]